MAQPMTMIGGTGMVRRPDMLRAAVVCFAIGLAITGLTSLQASEDQRRAPPPELTVEPQSRQAAG